MGSGLGETPHSLSVSLGSPLSPCSPVAPSWVHNSFCPISKVWQLSCSFLFWSPHYIISTHSTRSMTAAPGPRQGNIVSSREASKRGWTAVLHLPEPEGRGQQEGVRLADGRTSRLYEGVGNQEMVNVS